MTAPVAIAMTRTDKGPAQDALYNFHKSPGVLILFLMVLRLINRLVAAALAPEADIEPWQKTVSSVVHTSLYVLLLTMPVVGYVANSAYGAATPFFGCSS
jgi:cytochrome b561